MLKYEKIPEELYKQIITVAKLPVKQRINELIDSLIHHSDFSAANAM